MTELVERESALRALQGVMASAARSGKVALVAGEAGIGKTSVLRALARSQETVWWGCCDALQTPNPLAPLLDIIRDSRLALADRLEGPRAALFEAVLEELILAPAAVLVVIEDAHWADDATLDLLKFLGRRIERARAALVISFRDDEVPASHPLRGVIGELPPAVVARVDLLPLSPKGVEALAWRAGRPAAGLHEATRGNPFFVTEVLRDAGATLPRSVQDLVLARLSRLPGTARELVQLVSVAPGRIERRLVDELAAPTLADLEAGLGSGLLVADGHTLSFRHELARVAVESSLSPPTLQALHARLLGALTAKAPQPAAALLAHHAARACDTAAVSRFAPIAARQAAERGAHREAVAHWRSALRLGQPSGEPERRDWLDEFATECALTGMLDEALEASTELEAMALARADVCESAVQLSRRATLLTRQLRHAEANEVNRRARERIADQPLSLAHARVWSVEAVLRMLDRDCETSMHWARLGIPVAESFGDPVLADRMRGTLGTALLFIDFEEACVQLERTLQSQLGRGDHPAAAYTLLNFGSGAGELMRLQMAERHLRRAIELAVAHELDAHAWYSKAWLALCMLRTGRWDDAAALASEVVSRPQATRDSRVMALLAMATLRVRRGDPGADDALDEALELAGASGTLQRTAPMRAARAEAALARGNPAAAASEIGHALPLALASGHVWFIGELAYLAWRAGTLTQAPERCAEPYALQIDGRWREAAQAWKRLGCPFEEARALADGDAAARRAALAAFDALGARPAADELRRRMRDSGTAGVPRGPRPSTQRHPFGLTTRELEVLDLLCLGMRNAEIAARMHRSVRTVDHHVSAVFAKLGVATRTEAVRVALQAGIREIGQSTDAE